MQWRIARGTAVPGAAGGGAEGALKTIFVCISNAPKAPKYSLKSVIRDIVNKIFAVFGE